MSALDVRPPARRWLWRRPARRRPVALALQGGGAHRAFTWGVLDRLLEKGVAPAGLSGASAGACNAAVLAAGWQVGGADGARDRLARFWRGVADAAGEVGLPSGEFGAFAMGLASHLLSPYALNPTGIDPLGDLLADLVDFERLRAEPPFPLVIAATSVRTGRGRLFMEHELTPAAVLASAALPTLHRAVPIDGELYWDGGFTSNPPVAALAHRCGRADLVIVRLNRIESDETPRTAAAIRNRVAEVVFGRPLLLELERLAYKRRRWPAAWSPAIDVIDGDATLSALSPATRLAPEWRLLQQLHQAGRTRADLWLSARNGAGAQPASLSS